MSVLTLDNLTLRIAGRTLLDAASLAIAQGQRVGLLGRNGTGKSTLLRAIAGEIEPDGGRIRLANGARLGWVRQEAPSGATPLLDFVLAADTERAALLAALPTASPHDAADMHERLRVIGADAAPGRAAAILAGLGFAPAAQTRALAEFSGGWRMRVALAAVLFSAPDLLLLDEPTNHLDLEATLWLESYLARVPGACLIVSHDRHLLDACVTAIAHLDRGKIALTPGGYEAFLRIRTERALQQNRMAERIAARRADMQRFVDRFRASATKARQAQARLKALAKLPDIEVIEEDTQAVFNFPEPDPLPPPLLVLENASVGYDGREILTGLSQRLDLDDRVALLGANGNGKSTLAKLIAGRLAPMRGRVARPGKLRVGFFAQHQEDDLVLTETPFDHMQRVLPRAAPAAVRAQLARFGLDAHRALTQVARLSGGEKARLLLALATRDAPHLLILDEPTNHLDMDARDALVRALANFTGAVLLISHDAALVEAVADRLWLVADGKVTSYDGDMDDYRAWLLDRARAERADRPDRPIRPAPRPRKPDAAALRRAARAAEARLATLTDEKSRLEAWLAAEPAYLPANAAKTQAATIRLAALIEELEATEHAWLEAETALTA